MSVAVVAISTGIALRKHQISSYNIFLPVSCNRTSFVHEAPLHDAMWEAQHRTLHRLHAPGDDAALRRAIPGCPGRRHEERCAASFESPVQVYQKSII